MALALWLALRRAEEERRHWTPRKKPISEPIYAKYTKPCPGCGGTTTPRQWHDPLNAWHFDWRFWICTDCDGGISYGWFAALKMRLGFDRGKMGKLGKYAASAIPSLKYE